jgi:hypothetical protein
MPQDTQPTVQDDLLEAIEEDERSALLDELLSAV